MPSLSKLATFAVALLGAAGSAVAMSYYNAGIGTNEVIKFSVTLPAAEVPPVEVDLAAQRLPKALLAPNTVTFRAKSLVNGTDKPLDVRLSLEGNPAGAGVQINGNEADFSRITNIAAGGKANVYLIFTVPPAARGSATPLETALLVKNVDDGSTLARVPLRVFDSGAGGMSASMSDMPDHMMMDHSAH
ncbi:hypothetical protein [Oryzibacter oryziterrae]|uniref:hypothetical protein n=1 Tax=Oryzibacter oryziterrae TaxID=2766474 RepID=UPI001F33C2E6|nr:hypothetical protein [Oryzibacter oryziterrae]